VYEFFDHTADLGLRVRSPTLPRLFEEAALALFAAIVEEPPRGGPIAREFSIAGTRNDHLLFDWLTELLWRFESEHVVFGEFEVELVAEGLRARARGAALDESRQRLLHEVKAVTYHGLRVERIGQEWLAEAIVDI